MKVEESKKQAADLQEVSSLLFLVVIRHCGCRSGDKNTGDVRSHPPVKQVPVPHVSKEDSPDWI